MGRLRVYSRPDMLNPIARIPVGNCRNVVVLGRRQGARRAKELRTELPPLFGLNAGDGVRVGRGALLAQPRIA